MKRVISLIFLLICLLLILEFGTSFFKTEHKLEYQVNSLNTTFTIKEEYQKSKNNTYYLEITKDNYTFIYTVDNIFNKQKEIVDNIEIYEKDGMLCIYPIFINNEGLEIECSKENKLYSFESLKDNSFVQEFVSILKNKNYNSLSWKVESNVEEKVDTSIIYKENLLDSDYITVWNYKGLEIISKKYSNYKGIYNYDKYANNHGSVVGKYYIMPVYISDKVFDFSSLNIIDLENGSLKTMNLETTLNQDTYINGVVDNRLYYFDPDHLVQYEINPSNQKVRLVGDKEKNAQFYNGSWQTINIYDFVGNKKKFTLEIDEKLNNYQPISVYQSISNYYDNTSDGSFYKLNKNNLDMPILLWKKSGLKEVKVVGDTIYFMIGDTLYYYTDSTGIRKIVKNSEFNYNSTNIYDVYKKPNNE